MPRLSRVWRRVDGPTGQSGRLVSWSGLSADTFVKDEQGRPEPGSLAMISTYLKTDPHLTPEAADALDQLVKATYERMRKKGLGCHAEGVQD